MMTTSNEFARQREVVDVALAHAAMLEAGAVEPCARQRQHVERQIEAEPALDIAGEQFEHAPGAGAEIEQRADRLVAERGADRVFDRGVGDMELADAVPFRGVAAEIVLRRRGARRAYRGQPLAVAGDDRIVGIEPRQQRAGDVGRRRRARPAGRMPTSPRETARPVRLRRAAGDAGTAAAGIGAGFR